MMRKAALAALLAALLAGVIFAPGAALYAQTPAPGSPEDTIALGYWKLDASALLVVNDSEMKCIDGADDVKKFFDGPCKNHSVCTYKVRQVGGGKAKYADGTMVDRHGKNPTKVSAIGTYSAKRFEFNVQFGPVPGKLTGTWVAATCPAGAKH